MLYSTPASQDFRPSADHGNLTSSCEILNYISNNINCNCYVDSISSEAHESKETIIKNSRVSILEKALNNAHRVIMKLRMRDNILRHRVYRLRKCLVKRNASKVAFAAKFVIKNLKNYFLFKCKFGMTKNVNGLRLKKNLRSPYTNAVQSATNFCEKSTALPCVNLIHKWINELQTSTGINAGFFAKLSEKVVSINDYDGSCNCPNSSRVA